MEKPAKTFVSILLFVLAVEICVAQHWSYGLQPGGKRNAENAVGSFPEIPAPMGCCTTTFLHLSETVAVGSCQVVAGSTIANAMENQGEAQKTECPGPDQRSRFSDLKEAMASLMAGEARRKKI